MNDLIVGRSFGVLYRRTQAVIIATCRKLGLTYGEYALLMNLYQAEPGVLSQDDLSVSLCVDKAAVTRSLKSLEAKGLVSRERDAGDRRRNRLSITDAGRVETEKMQRVLHDWLELISTDWTRREKDSYREHLGRMAETAGKVDVEAFLETH